MAKSIGKEICECCGQTINTREVRLTKAHVKTLVRFMALEKQTGIHQYWKKSELIKRGVVKAGTEDSTFGDWVHFGGILYKGNEGQGYWGINAERARNFINGESTICIAGFKKGKEPDLLEEGKTFGTVHDIPGVSEFLDENQEYIVKYK